MLQKSVVLTNQAQPPAAPVINDDVVVTVLDRNPGQKWLGCMLIMLTAAGSMKQGVDLLHDIEQGTKCFHSNRWILQNRKSSVLSSLKYFDSVVSSRVCFSTGPRTLYKDHLLRLDISFRKLCSAIVAPPSQAVGMARYSAQLKYSGSRFRVCSCDNILDKNRM